MPAVRRRRTAAQDPRTLREYFDANPGRLMHKLLHYLPIYEQHFAPFRDRPVTVVEIGVSHGGSLDMWRWWCGPEATIVGVDVDPRCASLAGDGVHIEIGDQADPALLTRLRERYGPFHVVIDDGGHRPDQQLATIEGLWPAMADGGVYLVEDVCANYWDDYGGGLRRAGTFVERVKDLVDEMHAQHVRDETYAPSPFARTLVGLHVYDSVVVLDKAPVEHVVHRITGTAAFDTLYGQPVDDVRRRHQP